MNTNKRKGARKKLKMTYHDPSKKLSDPSLVFDAFMECLEEGDAQSAREILSGGLRHLNKAHLARNYRIPRRTAYNLLDRKSDPSLTLVAKVCRAIKQESNASGGLKTKNPKRSKRDPFWDVVGLGTGDGTPVSENHKEFLYGRGRPRTKIRKARSL